MDWGCVSTHTVDQSIDRSIDRSVDNLVQIVDVDRNVYLERLRHDGLVQCLAFSADGRHLAVAGEEKAVVVWDLRATDEVRGGGRDGAACQPYTHTPGTEMTCV